MSKKHCAWCGESPTHHSPEQLTKCRKYLADIAASKAKRTCLRCGKVFKSSGPANRTCERCLGKKVLPDYHRKMPSLGAGEADG